MRPFRFALLAVLVVWGQPTRSQQNIDRRRRSVNAQWGIYVKVLETGEEMAINADRQMDTMKIPLMVRAF